MKTLPLSFAIFCFIMAFFVAYNAGQRGLASVVIFMIMGVVAFFRAREG